MASIKYEIVRNFPGLNQTDFCREGGKRPPSTNTKQTYLTVALRYGRWAKSHYGCRTFASLGQHIQDYADWLAAEGKRPATIHGYVSALCYTWDIPLSSIQKPIRHCYDAVRSRGEKAINKRSDARRDASPRLYDLAEMVGIRRNEYRRLRQNNLVTDESGYLCVEVRRGKGGKYQLQRIRPEDELAVRSYFNGSGDFVFSRAEMTNKLDLHRARAQLAQRNYGYYLHRIRTEAGYRQQLEKEIRLRWEKFNHGRAWDESLVQGNYVIRGKNRQVARKNGFPVSFDKLAVMAVSVFHLSHWRCDVTVDNYLLAI